MKFEPHKTMLVSKTETGENTTNFKQNHLSSFLYISSIILCGLDFKASTSGKGFIVQAPIWGFYFLSFFFISMQHLSANSRISEMRFFIVICFSFGVATSAVGYWSGQDPWTIFTNVISFSVYMTAAVFTLIILKLCPDRTKMLNSMKNACFAFMILHFSMVYLTGGGIDLSNSRYSYLSGATIPASAILVIGAVLHFGKKEFLVAATNVAIILISVTRTQLLVIAGQFFSVLIAAPALAFRPSFLKKAIYVALLVITIIAVDIGAGTGLTNRWITRLTPKTTYIADPTALTRYAETYYMYDRFTSSFAHLMIGNGLAAITKLTGPAALQAGKLVGFGSVNSVHSAGFGHNNHMSVLFVGGLLVGGPLLFLNFLNGFQSFGLMRQLFKQREYNKEVIYIGIWGSLIVVGMLAEGFVSGIFSERANCLWYGIGTGMLYWAREETKQHTTSPLKGLHLEQ